MRKMVEIREKREQNISCFLSGMDGVADTDAQIAYQSFWIEFSSHPLLLLRYFSLFTVPLFSSLTHLLFVFSALCSPLFCLLILLISIPFLFVTIPTIPEMCTCNSVYVFDSTDGLGHIQGSRTSINSEGEHPLMLVLSSFCSHTKSLLS